jgi:alkylation response protein AidB-like acyl-CoA dehydrogenase
MNELGHSAALDPQASSAPRDLSSLLEALRATAAERDRDGGHAAQEKQWIADAGLLTLAVPREFGGAGAPWPTIYETIRAIARVDSALAHLLGFQCLQVVSVDVWGNQAQRARYLRGTVEARWCRQSARHPTGCDRNHRRRLSAERAERFLLRHARLADDDRVGPRPADRQADFRGRAHYA